VVAGPLTQYRQVSFASGYASSSAGPAHFGLGAHTAADLIEIRWPSGAVQQLKNERGNRVIRVREP
jgi:hypothetical protein